MIIWLMEVKINKIIIYRWKISHRVNNFKSGRIGLPKKRCKEACKYNNFDNEKMEEDPKKNSWYRIRLRNEKKCRNI